MLTRPGRLLQMARRVELGSLLNALGLNGLGVEVGVFRGEFAECLLSSWHGRELLVVDPWKHLPDYLDSWNLPDEGMEANYHKTLQRLHRFSGRFRALRMRSLEAAKTVPNSSLDFIYIDANHSYGHVRDDLHAWYPKLRDGGLMSGHDYFDALADKDYEPRPETMAQHHPKSLLTSYGVKSAVVEFARDLGVEFGVTTEDCPTWYFIKHTP